MVITETGSYKLLQDYTLRRGNSISSFPKGTVLTVTIIGKRNKQAVFIKEFDDWHHPRLPVFPIVEDGKYFYVKARVIKEVHVRVKMPTASEARKAVESQLKLRGCRVEIEPPLMNVCVVGEEIRCGTIEELRPDKR